MPVDPHTLVPESSVSLAPSPPTTGTTLGVSAGEGGRFPWATPFDLIVCPAGTNPQWSLGSVTSGNFEACRAIRTTSDTFTLTRAQYGTSARTIVIGDRVFQPVMPHDLTDLNYIGGVSLEPPVTPSSYILPEPVQVTQVGQAYEAFGFIAILADNTHTLVMITRHGAGHVGAGDYGTIQMRTSTDLGANWTNPTTIYSAAGLDCRPGMTGCVTPTGRILVFFARYNPDTGITQDFGRIYSDDRGATFSGYVTVPAGSNTAFLPHGPTVVLPDGRLMQGWYGIAGATETQYVIFSSDNGYSWGSQAVVYSASSGFLPCEGHFVSRGGRVISGWLRDDRTSPNGFLWRTASTDNGVTWSAPTMVTSDPVPPQSPVTFAPYKAADGQLAIAAYYVNRTTLKIYRVDMLGTVAAFDPANMTTVGSVTTADSGYLSAVHPNGSPYSLISYYDNGYTYVRRSAPSPRVARGSLRYTLDSVIRSNAPRLWVRAADLQAVDGAAVGAIYDRSANGNDLVQATGSLQPLLKKGANGIAGQPALRFDGTDDYLKTAGTIDLTAGYTLFVVCKFTTSKDYNGLFRLATDLTDPTSRLEIFGSATAFMFAASNRATTLSSFNQTGGGANATATNYLFVFSGGNGTATAVMRRNATNLAPSPSGGTDYRPAAAAAGFLGVGYSTGSVINGLIAEAVLFAGQLDLPTIGQIEAELNDLYAIY
jgi:BNR repeat protein